MKKMSLVLAALLLIATLGMVVGCAKGPKVSGTYVYTEGGTIGEEEMRYDKGDRLEFKADGTLYGGPEGGPTFTGKWRVDGNEIRISFEILGMEMSWKGTVKDDTIVLEDGSKWQKQK